MRVIGQVVPALPPRQEGIGGYALAIATTLRLRGVDTVFHCPGPAAVDFEVSTLESAPPGLPTLLHYANYGYHAHGMPSDLVARLEATRRSGRIPRLSVFFHEFVASGPPWRRSFWTAGAQRQLVRRLAGVADSAQTTISIYEDLLRGLAPHLPVRRLAMPSTVGEPVALPVWRQRKAMAIVFGGPGNRASVYRALSRCQGSLSEAGIEVIADVGPDSDLAPRRMGKVSIQTRGELPAAELSAVLLDSRLGFSAYPADFLGKSTAFAALAAHAVPCLALRKAEIALVEAPCLQAGRPLDDAGLEAVSLEVRSWYEKHDLAAHVDATLAAFGLTP
jgi:hypothetical protein